MPGKPRQRRGKYSAQARKYSDSSPNARPVQAVNQTPEAVAVTSPAAPARPRKAAAMPEDFVLEHPFIAAELKSIGLLALLVIVILVVLNFII